MSTTSNDKVVRISKALSYILRHGAQKEGIPIGNDGYAKVSDILLNKQFKNTTYSDVKLVVDTNDKKRFQLEERNGELYIRANQGHTMKDVSDIPFKRIESVADVPMVIHGTYRKHLKSILEKGLSKMERNHIHFAIGQQGNVVSGMRSNCDMVIHINLQKALDDKIEFFLSENNVCLTDGENGVLTSKYFSKITDRNGITIWQP
eukprot:gene5148-6408_t